MSTSNGTADKGWCLQVLRPDSALQQSKSNLGMISSSALDDNVKLFTGFFRVLLGRIRLLVFRV